MVRFRFRMPMFYLVVYILIGLILCAIVALIGRLRGKTDFTPISFVFGGGESFTFILSLLIWPVWIIVQLVEWSHPPVPAKTPIEAPTKPILPGTVGAAHTDLKPGGKVRIGEKLVDAISVSGLIKAGAEIEVIAPTPTGLSVRQKSPNS